MPDNFCHGKRQGAPYSHGKKSAQKLRGKHIFLEHDIDDKREHDSYINYFKRNKWHIQTYYEKTNGIVIASF